MGGTPSFYEMCVSAIHAIECGEWSFKLRCSMILNESVKCMQRLNLLIDASS